MEKEYISYDVRLGGCFKFIMKEMVDKLRQMEYTGKNDEYIVKEILKHHVQEIN